ncbi:MAG: hypothetical protein J6W54_00225 [Fibrobacter sp.]|uniref:hypothetical protein n=1 Tax=Fibrobacter sp. TaxID=35828 RepID=UPI001B104577|nr:hypothetical protein [Fibrobacter sp.]MBO7059516.1 hypothetical protein [Fibrobacter sp.]
MQFHTQKNAPAQKKDFNTAASVMDNSSQRESLQRRADLANGTAQQVVQRELNSNQDVENEDRTQYEIERDKFKLKDQDGRNQRTIQYSDGTTRNVVLYFGNDICAADESACLSMFEHWLTQLVKMSIVIPNDLEIYVSNNFTNQCSYNFDSGKICLKPSSINSLFDSGKRSTIPNIADSVPYAYSGDDKTKFGSAVIMHELGHVLHEKSSVNFFKQKQTPLIDGHTDRINSAKKVSLYVCKGEQSEAEFVAEVFTGLSNGLCFDEDVVSLYWQFNGPRCGELIERENHKYGFRNSKEMEIPD